MSAELAALTRTWRVGRHTCTLTVPRLRAGQTASASIEWDAGSPSSLSAAEWKQYRSGRNAAVAELAAELGISAAVLEV